MSALTALVVAAPSILGQTQEFPSNRLMKDFANDFLGRWTTEFVADTDVPGMFKKGDEMLWTVKFAWAVEGIIIQEDFTMELQGKTLQRIKALVGVDPRDQKVKVRSFTAPGGCGEIVWLQSAPRAFLS